MNSVINSIRSLFSAYGFRATAVIVATIVIVNLIKKPIIAKAKKHQNQTGQDKAVITKNITLLPVVVAFMLEFLIELTISNFNFMAVDYATVGANAVLYGALAVATFEGVKKQLEAYSAKRYEEINSSNPSQVEQKTEEKVLTTTLTNASSETNGNSIIFNTND